MLVLTPLPSRPQQTRQNLKHSVGDAVSFGAMVGLGETYLAAFALAAGLGEVMAGLVSSIPLLAGGVLQAVSPWAIRRIGSEKRWVVLCASLQALTFVPLVLAALYGSISGVVLLLVASAYWASGLATGPAWNTWIESIVPRGVRPKYFARRTRLAQLATLIGFVTAGLLLQWASAGDWLLQGFATIFLFAGLFRFASALFLVRHQTPDLPPQRPSAMLRGTSAPLADRGKWLLAYLVIVQGVVQISGPYFTPYMLQQVQFSYFQFTALLTAAFAAKVIALPVWAALAKRRGASWLLTLGGVGIVPLSALWIVADQFWYLLLVNFASGLVWAAYELGFFLLFFEALPTRNRTRLLTLYNLANTTAWCGGSLLGGWLLGYLGTTPSSYYVLFAVSSVGRLAALVLLAQTVGVRVPIRAIGVRILGVRPNSASLDSPILPTMPDAPAAAGGTA